MSKTLLTGGDGQNVTSIHDAKPLILCDLEPVGEVSLPIKCRLISDLSEMYICLDMAPK